MEETQDNRELFRQIVEEHNKKTGFDFVLPENTVYTSKYAHPEYQTTSYKLRGQIDTGNTFIYGIDILTEYGDIDLDREITKKELSKIVKSDAYKDGLKYLQMLNQLHSDLRDKINVVKASLTGDTLKEYEKEEAYDLTVKTAKVLYRS